MQLQLNNNTATTGQPHKGLQSLLAFSFLLAFLLSGSLVGRAQVNITSLSQITNSDGHYVITQDINGGTPGVSTFSGTLEANINSTTKMPYRIKNLGAPLFTTLTGTVKNLVLENVGISGNTGNTGAIACTANGNARIYNVGILSGSVSGSNYVGGLVGLLDGEARVVTCYSYADITGGTNVGGIVGYNNFETNSDSDKLKTMVFGCMFYGDITGGNDKAPIYNGEIISNKDGKGVSNFNYFCSEASYVQNQDIQTYNCALSAETRFLQRFEFFRHLLNGHRKVAAWWVNSTTPNPSEMMKWVMIPDSIGTNHPYPVLKEWGTYPSVVNYTPSTDVNKPRNQGRKMGTLSVTIQMDDADATDVPFHHPSGAEITTSSLDLIITDKDTTHFNFNYYKVQLPYYNDVGTKNYRKASDANDATSRVVTGWKIVSVTVNGTPTTTGTGTYYTGADVTFDASGNITKTPYNFADRTSTKKDLFSVSGRVFNQGAYWNVPEGVTAITIEPYWAKAAYLADEYADVVYNTGMDTKKNVPRVGGGQIFTNNTNSTINGESQKVYTSVVNARDALSSSSDHTVYDYAIVLVGNAHNIGISSDSKDLPYTLMSIDLDNDHEPDYSYILRFNGRSKAHPVRVDFLNIPGLGMAQKSTEGKGTYNFGIMQPIGWFEATNTALFRVTQFEYDYKKNSTDTRVVAPYIVQGGVIEQWVSGQNNGVSNNTTYFHVGGNVWFKEFHLGCHQDKTHKSKHPPISVTGGDFDAFYLTGLYSNAANYEDDAECYINGGCFGTMAGTGMEGIGKTSDHTKGNITWLINSADIKEFFGGGINAAKPAEGNINTIISHSHVDFFCGGPKFGDMNNGKTVKTTATDCSFGLYFGAGYGGNSYYSAAPGNFTNVNQDPWNSDEKGYNLDWDKWVTGEIKAQATNNGNYIYVRENGTSYQITYTGYHNDYISEFGGVSAAIDYQFLPMSDNQTNVGRLFLKFVKFSLATTRSITSTLTGCTIDSSFYGGGSLGKVAGNVVSTLDDCTVKGNVFGAGYSATLPEVSVMNTGGFNKQPYYDKDLGAYLPGVLPNTVDYTWEHKDQVNATSNAIDTDNHILYTEEIITKTNLGSVAGNVTLTLENTTVGTLENGTLKEGTGNVYGGGDQSTVQKAVDNNNNPIADTGNTTVILKGTTEVKGNVYAGGNRGAVSGNSEVKIQ